MPDPNDPNKTIKVTMENNYILMVCPQCRALYPTQIDNLKPLTCPRDLYSLREINVSEKIFFGFAGNPVLKGATGTIEVQPMVDKEDAKKDADK